MKLLKILFAVLAVLCLVSFGEAREVVRTRTVVRGGGAGAAVGVQRSTFVGRVGVAAGTVVVPPAHHHSHRSFAFRSFFAPSYSYARSFAYAAPYASFGYGASYYPSASYAYPAASYYATPAYAAAPCPQAAPVYSAPACTCQQAAQAYAAPASGCPCIAELAQLSAQIAELRAALGPPR